LIDRASFIEGMARLDVAFPTNADEKEKLARLTLYFEMIKLLEMDQWRHAVDDTIRTFTPPPMFPPVAVLLRRFNDQRNVMASAEAARMFDKVVSAVDYRLGGSFWSASRIQNELGSEAAHAFLAAGGDTAFRTMGERGGPFVKKAFVESYVAQRKAVPARKELSDGQRIEGPRRDRETGEGDGVD
jgi:hypothetical protein